MRQLALQNAGYDVVTARDGQEAIAACEAISGKIDVVLLDMSMPVMSGEETLARLEARWPQVNVIVTSGYDETDAQRRFGDRPAGFIQKPYTAARLAAKVAGILGRAAFR